LLGPTAVNTVARCWDLRRGDLILLTSLTYGAVQFNIACLEQHFALRAGLFWG
jgi:hypothetical protein